MDLGNYNRGSDQGPNAVRQSGLIEKLLAPGFDVVDIGDLSMKTSEQLTCNDVITLEMDHLAIDFHSIAHNVARIVTMNHFPLILGGDHSISIGTIAGTSPYYPIFA